jgi:uncharacterized membrane protein YphA (DoxX/SURF4 family)
MLTRPLLRIQSLVEQNAVIYFRGVLFLTFLGHGFVSLGFSPGYQLHYRIFESVNIFNLDIATALKVQGAMDIILAMTILAGVFPKYVLLYAICYVSAVAMCGWAYFTHKTGSLFGIAETFRRFPWLFYLIFLLYHYVFDIKYYRLLRVGIAFAFLAHGLASLGFFGLKGAHIELASQVLSEEVANKLVFYSGFTDTLIGVLLLTGILSRPAAIVGSLWLIVVVYLSMLLAFPDALFRTGFLLSAVYVAIDKRCHGLLFKSAIRGESLKI